MTTCNFSAATASRAERPTAQVKRVDYGKARVYAMVTTR
jgi:hypothetical protein